MQGPFHQEAFYSSSLSAIRVVSSAYLRLLIFLPTVLIPACASSSPAFLMLSYQLLNLQYSVVSYRHYSVHQSSKTYLCVTKSIQVWTISPTLYLPPLATINLFLVSVSQFFILVFQKSHANGIIQYLSFSDISLRIMPLQSISIIAKGKIYFIFMDE